MLILCLARSVFNDHISISALCRSRDFFITSFSSVLVGQLTAWCMSRPSTTCLSLFIDLKMSEASICIWYWIWLQFCWYAMCGCCRWLLGGCWGDWCMERRLATGLVWLPWWLL